MGFYDLKRLSSKYESGSREEGEDRNGGRGGGGVYEITKDMHR